MYLADLIDVASSRRISFKAQDGQAIYTCNSSRQGAALERNQLASIERYENVGSNYFCGAFSGLREFAAKARSVPHLHPGHGTCAPTSQ
jgi:hypothetical protein